MLPCGSERTSDSTTGVEGAELISDGQASAVKQLCFPEQRVLGEGQRVGLGGGGACLRLEGAAGESFVKGVPRWGHWLTMHAPGRADIPGGEPCEAAVHGLWA